MATFKIGGGLYNIKKKKWGLYYFIQTSTCMIDGFHVIKHCNWDPLPVGGQKALAEHYPLLTFPFSSKYPTDHEILHAEEKINYVSLYI